MEFKVGDEVMFCSKEQFGGIEAAYYGQRCIIKKFSDDWVYLTMPYYNGPISAVYQWEEYGGGGFRREMIRKLTKLDKALA